MITIEEIPVENINDFWEIHLRYLVDDGIIDDPEDIEYFSGEEYRGIIKIQRIHKQKASPIPLQYRGCYCYSLSVFLSSFCLYINV